eukprot:CAMPEP_0182560136 /NCGR_PEP_ID=MMETSP1324-20130603/2971_1 /TAXON_ID=236786 /ORGANISM="Florenciella sp., Strain RCC1587" /LENGTH=434 /DNA_ID=CAMNT_0024772471 /DNA_START=1 /DNA_END=1305 /DNA_ORIENTATION=-
MAFDVVAVLCGAAILAPGLWVMSELQEPFRTAAGYRAAIGLLGFVMSYTLIPTIAKYTLKANMFGKDLGKRFIPAMRDTPVPEALGIVPAIGFLCCIICAQWAFAKDDLEMMVTFNSALISVCFMVLLGFMDDVLDLPWRAKLALPLVATFPLLCTYSGSTSIVVPKPLRVLLYSAGSNTLTPIGQLLDALVVVDIEAQGAILELGPFYLAYMCCMAIFCTNAINIYAGINGLEAGQSFVIGCFIMLYCALQLSLDSEDHHHYMFALTLILPFVGNTLGLLAYNWYPSTVFVGDTFCYFAGMTFAVVGIHGHFTKPLWLFFLPQLANFFYSIPQLFKLVPCPRHRLPRVDEASGLMVPSGFECKAGQYRFWKAILLLPSDATEMPNFTVINWALRVLGPLSERDLCMALMVLQVVTCAAGLVLRFYAGGHFFDG